MTGNDYVADDVWHMACCLVGNCCFRMALRGEETTDPVLLAELRNLEAVFSGLPGDQCLCRVNGGTELCGSVGRSQARSIEVHTRVFALAVPFSGESVEAAAVLRSLPPG